MPDNYEHYISKNIQAFYRRRLFSPMIYLVLLAVLWIVFPLGAMLRPAQLSDNTKIADAYKNHHRYVRMTFTDLKFSGYTCETYGQTRGYYYYTTQKNNCSIILLTPHTCEEGLPTKTADCGYRFRSSSGQRKAGTKVPDKILFL